MTRIFFFIAVMITAFMTKGETYSYRFNATPLPTAIQLILNDHPNLDINFIYNELENYKTSSTVNTDNAYDALRKTIGMNPVTVVKVKNTYYVEALQHGRYIYKGNVMGTDNEPVAGATVMLLAPKDSTVITYGITDQSGKFSIPCDQQGVIGKLSCIGYKTTFERFSTFSVGTVIMEEKVVSLGAVTVEAESARLYADRSVYIPTARQKNASQTGIDLLGHMAISQLGLISGGSVVTNAGKPVSVFIDYLPATQSDLQAMRTDDVKRVEYYEYPSDPRLQGNPYVINFIMQKYEYGGYLKTVGHTNLISNTVGELLTNLRFQRKNMTYDIMGSTLHYDRKHEGSDLTETYRLPQETGEIKEFQRNSNTLASTKKQDWYFATVKATYNSDNIQASSQIKGKVDRNPNNEKSGCITYNTPDFNNTVYSSLLNERSQFITYEGYYFFRLHNKSSIVFNPTYSFSHTEQNTLYREIGFNDILNSATDNTNKLSGVLKFTHNFGSFGNLSLGMNGSYEYNRTRYSGSTSAFDRAKSFRVETGISYDVTIGKVYGTATLAWDWDRLQFGDMVDRPSTPKSSLSVQYSPNDHNSLNLLASYESWLPSPSFKSDKIIGATPLLKYTGNPNLIPAKSYDFDFTYTWIPNNDFSISAFAWAWFVDDRYVYDYEASSTGILRTIKQPMGSYAQGSYGVSGSAKFFDRNLVFSGRIGQLINHNGIPYNINHSHINWHARARYYLGNWNFTLTYVAGNASADGCMNGLWVYGKSDWYITAGWSGSHWNIRGDIINFTRWNYQNTHYVMKSKYYDTDEIITGGLSRAFIQLVATYTFGFGKRVKRDNELQVSGSASSGILK